MRTLLLLALLSAASTARAADSTEPLLTHTPLTEAIAPPLRVTARIADESKIFPQLFYRYDGKPYEMPLDMTRLKGAKDEYEATLPFQEGALDYYLECYDEFGNGPGRAGSLDKPFHLIVGGGKSSLPSGSPAGPALKEPLAVAPPPPAALSTRLSAPATPWTAEEALWHSAILPGWGQFRTERRLRGVLFGAATGLSLVSTLLLAVRANQANTIYESAPPLVQEAAHDQARSYATSRNIALGLTLGFWAANVVEAWVGHGTRDPW